MVTLFLLPFPIYMNSIKKNQRKKKEEEKKENFVLKHIKKRNTVSQENIFKLSDYTSICTL